MLFLIIDKGLVNNRALRKGFRKMRLDYEIKPVLVKKISYITHKGKKRDFKIIPHFHERAFQ